MALKHKRFRLAHTFSAESSGIGGVLAGILTPLLEIRATHLLPVSKGLLHTHNWRLDLRKSKRNLISSEEKLYAS